MRAPGYPVTDLRTDKSQFGARKSGIAAQPDERSLAGPVWRWWQWPHLLSLDAPLVAIVWQWWWAGTRGVHLSARYPLILGLAVWMIYLGDRLSDASPDGNSGLDTDRHRFYTEHRRFTAALLTVVIAALTVLTLFLLPLHEFLGGILLLILTGLYFWIIHRASRPAKAWIPKEAVVGVLFAFGSGFFTAFKVVQIDAHFALDIVFFGVLCFLNCGFITRWEQNPRDLMDTESLLRAFPRLAAALPEMAIGLSLATGVIALAQKDAALFPITLAAVALWMLDRLRFQLPAGALRVLADVVLFTPPLLWVWHRFVP